MVRWQEQKKAIAGGVVALVGLLGALGVFAPDAFDAEKIEALVLAVLSGVGAVYAAVYQISNDDSKGETKNDLDLHVHPLVIVGAVWLAAMVMTGCATAPQVETTEERLLLSTITVKSLAMETKSARDAGRISDEQAQEIKAQLGYALTAIRGARNALDVGEVDRASALLLGLSQTLSVVRGILDGQERTGARGDPRAGHRYFSALDRGHDTRRLPAREAGGARARAPGYA